MIPNMANLPIALRSQEFAELMKNCQITGPNLSPIALETGMVECLKTLAEAREQGASVYVIGNGGSAAVASHAVIDLVNVAKMRAFTLHEPSVLTCIVNDYGYEVAYSKLLAHMARPGDVLIAISSSGKSQNIRNATQQVMDNGGKVITLSGFASDNPLRPMGTVNIWLDASDYGLVEIGHQFLLHNLSDRFWAGWKADA